MAMHIRSDVVFLLLTKRPERVQNVFLKTGAKAGIIYF